MPIYFMFFTKVYFKKMSEFQRLKDRFADSGYIYIDHYYSEEKPVGTLNIPENGEIKQMPLCGMIWFKRM